MANTYPNENNDDYSSDEYDSSVYTSDSENIEIEDDYMFEEDEEEQEDMVDEMTLDTKSSSHIDTKDLPKINTAIPEINPWTGKSNKESFVSDKSHLVPLQEIMNQQVVEEALSKQKKKEAEKQKQMNEVKSKFMLLSQKNNPNYNKKSNNNQKKTVIRRRKPKSQDK